MKPKEFFALVALVFLSSCASSSTTSMDGYWAGTMEMNGKAVDISVSVDSDKGLLSSNDLMLFEQPVQDLKCNGNRISFAVDVETIFTFDGTVNDGEVSGSVNIQGMPSSMKIGFRLKKEASTAPARSYTVEKLMVKSNGADLSADIYCPTTAKQHPALVLLQGSTTNLKRDYSFYANFFANLGFEVLIFDKRGSGESSGSYDAASYDDLATDAIACLTTMKSRESVDTTRIGLWGFSQGAMLLPFVASKTTIPSFLIAVSPEVVSVSEAAAFSDSLRIVSRGSSPADGHVAAESHRTVVRMIAGESSLGDVENFINSNARKYSFMDQTGLYGNTSISKVAFDGYYWKGQTTNFLPYWRCIGIKTLVLFGEDDEYVNALRNNQILTDFRNSNIEIKLFPRTNHAMKKAFNPAKYPDMDWPRVTAGYLDFAKEWVDREVKM